MSPSEGLLPWLLFIQKDLSLSQCFKLNMLVMGSRAGPAADRWLSNAAAVRAGADGGCDQAPPLPPVLRGRWWPGT